MIVDINRITLTETKAFTLYGLENKILFFDYRDNITIELDDVKEAFDLYIEHSENHTCKVLLVFGQYSTIEVEARKYAESKKMPTPAQAIVIRNLAQRMLAKFYKTLRKDSHPLKFFGNTDDAISWLEQHKP
ncbi:MAG: hypothetical protein HRT58_02060 [Crocinitomicaceae bacterium]|nr:hypothetical protein [Flavobacteriales bacterium]NQZ34411.1 hypothetical protein [Crocinitomicaceae bacterium]